jgi:hypothetical protein
MTSHATASTCTRSCCAGTNFFVSALDGGYSEGATFVDAQASTRKRKLPDTFNSSSSSAPDAGESPVTS